MKVVLLVRDLDLGGAQRQVVQLAAGLRGLGDEVVVALWRPGGALEDRLRTADVRMHVMRAGWRGDVFRLADELRELVTQAGVEVVYSLMPVENFVASLGCRSTRVPVVWGIRTSAAAVGKSPVAQRLLFLVQRAFSFVPAAIITNSAAGRSLAGPFVGRRRLHTVANGTDTDYFRPSPGQRSLFRNEVGIDLAATVVAVVGRLEPQKGVETVLDAAAAISGRRDAVVYLLVGRGKTEYLERVRNLVRAKDLGDIVRLVEQQSDIRRVYWASDILVSASGGEGMSNVIAEAMSSGLKVVASDVGDNAAALGDCGWIFKAADPVDLARALDDAISDQRTDFGVKARERVERYFSMMAMVGGTRQVLATVVGQHPRHG